MIIRKVVELTEATIEIIELSIITAVRTLNLLSLHFIFHKLTRRINFYGMVLTEVCQHVLCILPKSNKNIGRFT